MKHLLALLCATIALIDSVVGHGELHEAITALEKELTKKPGNSQLVLRIADLHRLHGDPEVALAHLAVLDAKTHPEVLLVRGHIFESKGKTESALATTKAFTEVRPKHAQGWFQYARLLAHHNKFHDAAEAQQRGIQAAAATADEYLTAASYHQSDGQPRHALTVIDKGVVRHPKHLGLAESRARLLFQTNQEPMAAAQWQDLRTAHPKLAFRWWKTEGDLTKASDPTRSQQAYRKALEQLGERFAERPPPPALRTIMEELSALVTADGPEAIPSP